MIHILKRYDSYLILNVPVAFAMTPTVMAGAARTAQPIMDSTESVRAAEALRRERMRWK